jgi:hypothetical protein
MAKPVYCSIFLLTLPGVLKKWRWDMFRDTAMRIVEEINPRFFSLWWFPQ